ncbi:MAG: ABC transporter permease [Bryobacterales bacterium]|nr:ABC transporter permease [Bryobacterales bacterium]
MRTIARAFLEELRGVVRNPGALLVLVGAIVLYALFYPIPYSPQVLKNVPIVVVDLDRSNLSRSLLRMIDSNELLTVRAMAESLAEAEKQVRNNQAGGTLFPANFERSVLRGEQAYLAAYADASYLLIYRQVLTGLLTTAGTLSAGVELRRLEARGIQGEQAAAARVPIEYSARPLFNAVEGYATFVVPSVLVLILQQTILIGAGLVAGSRRELAGSDPLFRPSAAPLVVIGRAAFYLILYWLHAWFYFGPLSAWYGFPQEGDPLVLALFTQPYLLAAIFLGLAGAAFFAERQRAIQVFAVTSLPMVLVAGVVWPSELIPHWLRALASMVPSTPAIAGYLRINMMGANLAEVDAEYQHLWVLCIGYFLLACALQIWASLRARKSRTPMPLLER